MQNLKTKLNAQGGFTLIEMLVVVAIIVILAAVSIPVVNTNLEEARDATDLANERAAKTLALLYYMGGIEQSSIDGFVDEMSGSDTPIYTPGSPIDADPYAIISKGSKYLFYDAENGVLTYKLPEKAYGQCKGGAKDKYSTAEHVGKVIMIQVDEKGVFTAHWRFNVNEEDVI